MASVGLLRTIALFASLTDDELEALAAALVRRVYARGSIILHQGSPGATLHIIESGKVRIFTLSDSGQEMSLNVCGPGQVLGELSLLDGLPCSASAVALEQTVTQTWERSSFLSYLETHPILAQHLIAILSKRLRHATAYAESMVFLDVAGRLAAKLLDLAAWSGSFGAPSRDLAISQAELATWVGATRETVNRILNEFANQGLVSLREQHITLVDMAGLQKKIGT
jgi:CRP/FNR family transcriptional regulator, cyclic AMP receptor protein